MNKKPTARLGIIGGSGLYDIEELRDVREIQLKTPFGAPSDSIRIGELRGVKVAFLPRHGRGHRLMPHEIPQKANIYALKSLGVDTIISVSAVGSLKEELRPRHFVFPSQLVDETKRRDSTFFGNGIVAHVPFAEPFCDSLIDTLYSRAVELNITAHKGGTLVCMEGPQFSTKAESLYHRAMGYSIIGMTACPEAKLAREAQLCYVPVSLVTDYDVWKEGEEVTASAVLETLAHNIATVKQLLADAVTHLASAERHCHCRDSIKSSVVTDPKHISKETYAKLKLLLQ